MKLEKMSKGLEVAYFEKRDDDGYIPVRIVKISNREVVVEDVKGKLYAIPVRPDPVAGAFAPGLVPKEKLADKKFRSLEGVIDYMQNEL
jgi:hypothetical protein